VDIALFIMLIIILMFVSFTLHLKVLVTMNLLTSNPTWN